MSDQALGATPSRRRKIAGERRDQLVKPAGVEVTPEPDVSRPDVSKPAKSKPAQATSRSSRRLGTVGPIAGLIVVVTIFFMSYKPFM